MFSLAHGEGLVQHYTGEAGGNVQRRLLPRTPAVILLHQVTKPGLTTSSSSRPNSKQSSSNSSSAGGEGKKRKKRVGFGLQAELGALKLNSVAFILIISDNFEKRGVKTT